MDKIIFISEIQDPTSLGFSTQILTSNLLSGLKENKYEVIFIAITDDDCNDRNVANYYQKLVDDIQIIKSKFPIRLTKNKYEAALKLLIKSIYSEHYRNDVKKLKVPNDALILTHSPSVESVLVAHQLKKKHNFKHIQFWSDPIAIAGIYPKDLNFQRKIYKFVEKNILKKSDEIVYATEILHNYQKNIYSRLSNKMRWIDVSYSSMKLRNIKKYDKFHIVYSGSYRSTIRNIKNLYEAVNRSDEYELTIVGDSDIDFNPQKNVHIIKGRYPQSKISEIEETANILVTVLNHSCIQIPGKVFYNLNSDKHLLVILDGEISNEIKDYLSKTNRYVYCENTVESITKVLNEISSKDYEFERKEYLKAYSPYSIAKKILEGEIDGK